MLIAYCAKCSEVIAAGDLPDRVRVRGRKIPCSYSHTVAGESHEASLVEIEDIPRKEGESVGAYLIRLAKGRPK